MSGKNLQNTLTEHKECVTGFVLHDNVLISCSLDKTIKYWDITGDSTQSVKTLTGHTGGVNCITMGKPQDNELLFSGADDKEIKVWNIQTGECLRSLRHGDNVNCVLFWNTTLFTGGDDNSIKIWTQDGTCKETLSGHTDWVVSLALAGGKLYSCSDDGSVRVWTQDPDTEKTTYERTITPGPNAEDLSEALGKAIEMLTGNPDSSGDGIQEDTTEPQQQQQQQQEGESLLGDDAQAALQQCQNMSPEELRAMVENVDEDRSSINCMLILGSKMFCGTASTVFVYDLENNKEVGCLEGHKDEVRYLCCSPDQQRVFSCGDDGLILEWNPHNADCINTYEVGQSPVFSAICITTEKGEEVLVSGSDDASIKIWA